MYVQTFSREALAQELGSDFRTAAPVQKNEIGPVGTGQVTALWAQRKSKGTDLPQVFVLPPGEKEDFFAWTWTYFPHLRPLSSVCRVLGFDEWSSVSDVSAVSYSELQAFHVGSVLCEAATYLGPRGREGLHSPSAYQRTLSYILCRASALGRAQEEESLADRWVECRRLTGHESLALSAETVLAVWATFSGRGAGVGVDSRIIESIEQLRRGVGPRGLLTLGLYEEDAVEFREDNPKESRVKKFERIVELMLKTGGEGNAVQRDFVVAYAANLIDQGSLTYIGLLQDVIVEFPRCLMWYGLCAATSPGAAARKVESSLVRRLRYSLERPWTVFERPECDIAYDELLLVSKEPTKTEHLASWSRAFLVVELGPGITGAFGRQPRTGADRSVQMDLMSMDPEIRSIVMNIRDTAYLLASRVDDLAGIVEPREDRDKAAGSRGRRRKK